MLLAGAPPLSPGRDALCKPVRQLRRLSSGPLALPAAGRCLRQQASAGWGEAAPIVQAKLLALHLPSLLVVQSQDTDIPCDGDV